MNCDRDALRVQGDLIIKVILTTRTTKTVKLDSVCKFERV